MDIVFTHVWSNNGEGLPVTHSGPIGNFFVKSERNDGISRVVTNVCVRVKPPPGNAIKVVFVRHAVHKANIRSYVL